MIAFSLVIFLGYWCMFVLGMAWQSPASYQRGKLDGALETEWQSFQARINAWKLAERFYKAYYENIHAAYVLKNKPCAYNAPCKQKARARDPVTGRILKRGAV